MMGATSAIEWTDATWNPWRGCRKVSAGCANCYMFREQRRFGKDPATVVRASPPTFNLPLRLATGTRVFTCSWSDFFIEDADPWRLEAWDIIRERPGLHFLILTKRPENIPDRLPPDWVDGWPNVWLGASIEDQRTADKRIPMLLDTPAVHRFLSYEPALGPVDFSAYFGGPYVGLPGDKVYPNYNPGIDWIIVGGESGPHARPCNVEWIRATVKTCRSAKIPVFVKQLGTKPESPSHCRMRTLSPKGADPSEWPTDLRVRETPRF